MNAVQCDRLQGYPCSTLTGLTTEVVFAVGVSKRRWNDIDVKRECQD
jgi:hypothetical protein